MWQHVHVAMLNFFMEIHVRFISLIIAPVRVLCFDDEKSIHTCQVSLAAHHMTRV